MSIISVKNLDFEYSGKEVLHNVSFNIEEGSVVALVGPNGAGKTTLMRCIAALEKPMAGKITVDGIDVAENPRSVHRKMGYLSDFFGLYNRLTCYQCIKYTAWCQNIPTDELEKRIQEVVEITDLKDYVEKKAGTLSRGYRQRLGVALSLIHRPKLLLLDEPASGMDPEARVKLSTLFHRLKAEGMTIIVSSHILAELEDYCTDMLVLRDGRIVDHVTLDEHEEQTMLNLTITALAITEEHVEVLKAQENITDMKAKGAQVECIFTGNEMEQALLLKNLIEKGVPVTGFKTSKKTLQKAYMELAENGQETMEKDERA